MTIGGLGHSFHLLVACFRIPYADVFPNGFVKEKIILGNIADLTHELSKRNIANILPAKTDCSGGRIPKAGHQLGNRGLARARWADDSGHGTGLRLE